MGKVEEKEINISELGVIIGAICVEICHETDYEAEEICNICSKVSYKLIGHLSGERPVNQAYISLSAQIHKSVSAMIDALKE